MIDSVLLIEEAFGVLWSQVHALIYPACFFLLLAAIIHRKNLVGIFKPMFPSGLWVNICSYVFDGLVVVGPMLYLLSEISGFVQSKGIALLGVGLFDQLPTVCVAFFVLFVADAICYFRHRLEHSNIFWPAHALHHSGQEMTWFTLFRVHPFNRLAAALVDNSILMLVGFPVWAIALNGAVRHYYGMFVHANLPWTYGPLGRIFVSPAMHRWHHVLEGRGVNCNFAGVFSVFDQVFRTYYVPGPCTQPLGVREINGSSFLYQLIYPITVLVQYIKLRSRRIHSS